MKKELNEKNHTTQHPPQPRDGTLNRRLPVQEANWFGTAHEPQEEFCELDSNEAIRKHSDDRRGQPLVK